jgi:predicted transglutaminase-like cysteine proteinase
MQVGTVTSQPIGHYEFCKLHADECRVRSSDTRAFELTNKVRRSIDALNRAVNTGVVATLDIENYGTDEVWTYPENGKGDCEDFALEKRKQLHETLHIPLTDLLLTVVRQPNGDGHAVLTVRTDRGDFILDNLVDDMKLWRNTEYKYLKRQDERYTGRWVSLDLAETTQYLAAIGRKK